MDPYDIFKGLLDIISKRDPTFTNMIQEITILIMQIHMMMSILKLVMKNQVVMIVMKVQAAK